MPEGERYMISIVTEVLLLIILFFMPACSGKKFLRILGINKENHLELFVLSVASGFALISLGLLLLGMTGFLTPASMCLVHINFFIMSAKEAIAFFKTFIS
jgi:hypothetical protein